MKKMIVFAAALVAAVMSQAANLDWKYAGAASDEGAMVYVLLGSTAVTEWENAAAVQKAALGSGEVKKKLSNYTANGTVISDSITKDNASVYYVLVAQDGNSYSVTSVSDMTGSVYDPAQQQSSPGANTSLTSRSIAQSGLAWGGGSDPVVPTPTPVDPSGVPEPTSGLLLLVGGAALALRRKQK